MNSISVYKKHVLFSHDISQHVKFNFLNFLENKDHKLWSDDLISVSLRITFVFNSIILLPKGIG